MMQKATEYRRLEEKRRRKTGQLYGRGRACDVRAVLFIASLITGVFTYMRVWQKYGFAGGAGMWHRLEEGQTLSEMESNAQQDYGGYFCCGKRRNISLKERETESQEPRNETETDISVKSLIRKIFSGCLGLPEFKRGEISGSSL